MKYLPLFYLLFGFLATSTNAQDFDASVKMDQIGAGSYIILKGYYTDALDTPNYVSHVYAGRSGGFYRMQIYQGRFPDGIKTLGICARYHRYQQEK